MTRRSRPRMAALGRLGLGLGLGLGLVMVDLLGCGEGLPPVRLELSKNCNDVQVQTLAARVGEGEGETVLDVAADGALGDSAWVLVHRSTGAGSEVVVQRVSTRGVEDEVLLPVQTSSVSLVPAPESGRVWVVRDQPGLLQLWRVAPDDPVRPLLGSDELSSFPSTGPLCEDCDGADWPRRLIFLSGTPALLSLPRSSKDAVLVVWVASLATDGAQISLDREHRLNFEPPCDDTSPEAQAFCEEQRMNLRYPEVTLLGVQQDPRQPQTVLFGHRTRSQSYDGESFPLESADVFMVSVFLDDDGGPAGVLRSYSGFYDGSEPVGSSVPPLPTADPPHGVAIDRFASYGLFSNGGQLARLVQLPDTDPNFTELSGRVSLPLEGSLLQLDRDLAMGQVVDGAWEITKLFPDDPGQSQVRRYDGDAPIVEVLSGGVGTFLLRKEGIPPEVVRVRCPELGVSDEG